MSVGDALREVDAQQLIATEFTVTTGFLVSNVRLDMALKRHWEHREQDKNSIMTMVLKEASRVHSCRTKDQSGVFVLDPKTEECMHYKPVTALPRERSIDIETEVFHNRSVVEFRNDIIDPRVYICSPEVRGTSSDFDMSC